MVGIEFSGMVTMVAVVILLEWLDVVWCNAVVVVVVVWCNSCSVV